MPASLKWPLGHRADEQDSTGHSPTADPQGEGPGPGTPVIIGGDLLAILQLGGGDRKHLEGM